MVIIEGTLMDSFKDLPFRHGFKKTYVLCGYNHKNINLTITIISSK